MQKVMIVVYCILHTIFNLMQFVGTIVLAWICKFNGLDPFVTENVDMSKLLLLICILGSWYCLFYILNIQVLTKLKRAFSGDTNK